MGKVAIMHQRTTTPPTNILASLAELQKWATAQTSLHRTIREARGNVPLVRFHQQQLGRQTCCYTTWRRYHVWDRPLWRIYVNVDYGVGFEVPEEGATPQRAWEALSDYINAVLNSDPLVRNSTGNP